jgi:hypothetical protein
VIRITLLLLSLIAEPCLAQGLTATSPLGGLPAATFVPNTNVAVVTIVDGKNTITLGLNASAVSPSTVTDDGEGNFLATPGPGALPNLARWTFNFYIRAVETVGGSDVLSSYHFDLLYDLDPGNSTAASALGRINPAGFPVFPAGTVQNSLNIGAAYFRATIPGLITPAQGYAAPNGGVFDPNALGQYSFGLRAFKASGGDPLGEVAIHVNTASDLVPNPSQTYQVRYLTNLSLGDSSIRITNSGARGAAEPAGIDSSTTGAICANLYAFASDGTFLSCCSCPVTPNGLVTLSGREDLFSNTAEPTVSDSMVVKLLASVPQAGTSGCAGAAGGVTRATSTPGAGQLTTGLHAWSTTIYAQPGTQPTVIEAPFVPATLGVVAGSGSDVGELNRLTQLCTRYQANGAGPSICSSCRLGGGRL